MKHKLHTLIYQFNSINCDNVLSNPHMEAKCLSRPLYKRCFRKEIANCELHMSRSMRDKWSMISDSMCTSPMKHILTLHQWYKGLYCVSWGIITTQKIFKEHGDKTGVKLYIAAWINWHKRADRLQFYNDEKVHTKCPQWEAELPHE